MKTKRNPKVRKRKYSRKVTAFLMIVMMMLTMIPGMVFADSSTQDGKLIWSYKGNDSEYGQYKGVSSPAIDDGYIYAARDMDVYKLDAKTGDLKGKATLSGNSIDYNKLAPTVADTTSGKKVLVPLKGGKLAIINAETMRSEGIVTYKAGDDYAQSLTPAVYSASDNSVYLGSYTSGSGGVYAKVSLDNYNVTQIAEDSYGFYWAGACVTDEYVIFGSNSTTSRDYPDTGNAKLYVYDKTNGAVKGTVLEGSGSICSTVVSYNGSFYVVAKNNKMYEFNLTESGEAEVEQSIALSGVSTCTPYIADGKAYVGSSKNVDVIDLSTCKVLNKYNVPADSKFVTVKDGKIFATYNNKPGGIYDVTAGKDYFTPENSMQQYCISNIVQGDDGTLYYCNDSNYIMAVKSEASDKPGTGDTEKPPTGDSVTSVDVYVTISVKGNLVTAQEEVNVIDANENGKLDIDDALTIAHEKLYNGGAAEGYESGMTVYGLSLTKLWGDASGSYGYYVNNKPAWSLEDEVKQGDYVNAFVYKDGADWSDVYTYFDKNTVTVRPGEELKITLNAAGYDAEYNPVSVPVENATVIVKKSDDKAKSAAGKVTTDKNGQAVLTFREAGEYLISAESDTQTLVPPVMKVTVKGDASAGNLSNDETSNPSKDKTGSGVQTDDVMNYMFFFTLMIAAGTVAIVVKKRRA